jgi:hypothetical protein
LRHRHRRGLGPTIEYAQRRIRSDAVIVHDGVSPIDPNQVRTLWRNCMKETAAGDSAATAAKLQSAVCDFANLPAIHAAMEHAHARVLGFQWLTPPATDAAKPTNQDAEGTAPRTDAPHFKQRMGMGRIPPLPRPKFISALTEFALGE